MSRRGFAHWQALALAEAGVLAVWLAVPGAVPAVAAAAGALLLAAFAAVERRAAVAATALAALVGAAVAGVTTLRVRAAEADWNGVRDRLVADAGSRLDADLLDAVTAVRTLAETGARAATGSRDAAFDALTAAADRSVELGVAVVDGSDRPWAWAGRHRASPSPTGAELEAAITPFYVLLIARRQSDNGYTAVAAATLAADSAVPDRGETIAARFTDATGAALRFFLPGQAPASHDVFDYCVPACSPGAGPAPDTLFSVRMSPPSQGAWRLAAERGGLAWASVALLGLLAVLVITGSPAARVVAALGAGLALVLTPAGPNLAPGGLFSAATYFQSALGPFSASAGALIVTAALVLVVGIMAWRYGLARHPVTYLPAALIIVAAPYMLRELAAGISPPAAGAGIGLWMGWEMAVMAASAALLMLAAALVRSPDAPAAPGWMAVLAILWAAATVVLGLVLWQPQTAWPAWYTWLWVPAIVLAIQPARPPRLVATLAVVAGSAAALLTWGAAAEGRLLLAGRDAAGLRQGADAIAVGLLERFGTRLRDEAPPVTSADLYARWQRSALAADEYPAMLASWEPGGVLDEEVVLADLDLPPGITRSVALTAAARDSVHVQAIPGITGTHYVLGVPFPDGRLVTVAIGPRSRAIPPVRIARFLRGEPPLLPPYEIGLAAPVSGGNAPPVDRLAWSRDGWTARGEELLDLPHGVRHLHAQVPLGTPGPLLVRGTLVILLNAAFVALLWLLADELRGRLSIPPGWLSALRRPSYRTRLAVALAVFFVVPTVGFATWTARRLAQEAGRSRDLIIRQTLQDAGGTVRDVIALPDAAAARRLPEVASRFGTDLLVYDGGRLRFASAPVLEQLGLVDRFLPPPVYGALVAGDDPEIALDRQVGGRATRVGYRSLGVMSGRPAVLAAPRLVDDARLLESERDLVFGLLLATLAGVAAAAGLATVAARSLSRPVRALQSAAEAVGRGQLPRPFGPDVPREFVPVMKAFERMARDVNAGRAALEAQRRRTATVLRNVATGVVAVDEALRVQIANPQAERLLGTPLARGTALLDTTTGDWHPVWEWVLGVRQGALGDEDVRDFSIGEREIRAQRAPLGEGGGWVVALDDTTELTHAVRVLAWGELARQIAHEIKNPLTPIRLGIQHLRRTWDAPRGDYGETLDQTSRQMLAEIERLDAIARAFSRFGAPPAEAEPLTAVDVLVVARDTAALYTLGEGATIDVRGDGPAIAMVRRDELKEVLINLVENARNAGARHILIAVEDGRGGGSRVRLTVHDDGRGITAEHLPRIFDPQFSTTTSGSGLGLAICRRLVESWGGRIGVESTAGQGTRVRLELDDGAAPDGNG